MMGCDEEVVGRSRREKIRDSRNFFALSGAAFDWPIHVTYVRYLRAVNESTDDYLIGQT